MNKKRIYCAIISLILIVAISFSAVGCTVVPATTTTTTTTTSTTFPSDIKDPFEEGGAQGLTPSTLYLIDVLFHGLAFKDYDQEAALVAAIRAYIAATGDKYAAYYTPEEMEYDQKRTAYLEPLGLKVIRFSNLDVIHNFRAVCEAIYQNVEVRTAQKE